MKCWAYMITTHTATPIWNEVGEEFETLNHAAQNAIADLDEQGFVGAEQVFSNDLYSICTVPAKYSEPYASWMPASLLIVSRTHQDV